jgi:hypothetical protein
MKGCFMKILRGKQTNNPNNPDIPNNVTNSGNCRKRASHLAKQLCELVTLPSSHR